MAVKKKENRIKTEYAKLSNLYQNIPQNRRELVEKLIQNAAFMAATLEDLQAEINANGPVTVQTNGNGFTVTQEAAAQKSYNTMINRYATVIAKLADLLPDEPNASKLDAFLNDE